MGSKRLPKKSLRLLHGRELLGRVLDGVRDARLLDGICLCTTEQKIDDPIAEFARREGVECFRGSESDVLSRFIEASHIYRPDTIVRVCADNPFVNGREVDRLVEAFGSGVYDYGFNHIPTESNGYPDGLGAEMVQARLLEEIYPRTDNRDREHVTQFFLRHADEFSILELQAPKAIANPKAKLDVDTQADFEQMESFLAFLEQRGVEVSDAPAVVRSYEEFFGL